MTIRSFKYLYRHDEYGIIETSIYDEDIEVSVGNYMRINSRIGLHYFRVTKVIKLVDEHEQTIVFIVYLDIIDDVSSIIE